MRDLEKSQQSRNEKITDAKFNPYENRDKLKVSRTDQYDEATEFKKLSTKKKESSNAWIFWVLLFAIAIGYFLLFK